MKLYLELMSFEEDIDKRRHELNREILNLRDEIAHDMEARNDEDKINQLKFDESELSILDDMKQKIEKILEKHSNVLDELVAK